MNKTGGIFAYLFWVFIGFALGLWVAFKILKPYICNGIF